jgi:uncharacterized RDD family membrane protein YckC
MLEEADRAGKTGVVLESNRPIEPAGMVSRAGAFGIDLFAGFAVTSAVAQAIPGTLGILAGIAGAAGYVVVCWASGGTLGDDYMRITVIGTDGKVIGYPRAALRLVALIAGSIPFFAGFTSALSDERRQAWHDKVAKTYVIKSPARNRSPRWFWRVATGAEKWVPDPFVVTSQRRWPLVVALLPTIPLGFATLTLLFLVANGGRSVSPSTEDAGSRTDGTFAKDAGSETYHLDGRTVTLTNGVFQEPYDAWLNRPRNPYDNAEAKAAYLPPEPMTPGKVAIVRLTDKRLVGPVSSEGMPGEAVFFTFTAGGDSTHYYVTLRRTNGKWHGATTNSILLGDRISVEAVRIEGGKLFVDTLDRKAGEPLTTAPSVRITRAFVDAGGRLDEIK